MIIGRFKVSCHPERAEEVAAAIVAIDESTQKLPGVVHFDVVRELGDPNTFLAFEVYDDRADLDRQNAQPEVAAMLRLLEGGAAAGPYEWTVWEATPS